MSQPEKDISQESKIIVPSVQVALMRHTDNHDIEFFLLHRISGGFVDQWAFAGGKKDPGETDPETGCREIFEETGVLLNPSQLVLLRDTESTTNRIINGQTFTYQYSIKVFYAFIDGLSPSNASPDEHDSGCWFSSKEILGDDYTQSLVSGLISIKPTISPKTLESIQILSKSF